MNKNSLATAVIVITLLVIPMVLPYFLGNIVLPIWVYLIYSVVILVNSGLFLTNSLYLIENVLLGGKRMRYAVINFLLVFLGLGIEWLSVHYFESFMSSDYQIDEILSLESRIAEIATAFFLEVLSIAASVSFVLSDNWKRAQLRYQLYKNKNAKLAEEISHLEEKINTLKQNCDSSDKPDEAGTITIKVDLMKRKLRIDDITYIESDGDYINIHTAEGQSFMTLMRMKSMEIALPFDSFCRVHRSYIVNVDKVEAIKDRKIIILGKEIPLAQSSKAAFFEIISHKNILLKQV